MRYKLVFICTGNLYRSYAAEVMARKIFGYQVEVLSAGVSDASGNNKKVPKRLIDALRKMGYNPDEKARSKKVTLSMVRDARKICYMQNSHKEDLHKMFPTLDPNRVKPLALYSPNTKIEKIRDLAFIHNTHQFNVVLKEIEGCIQNLHFELSR